VPESKKGNDEDDGDGFNLLGDLLIVGKDAVEK